MAKRAEADCEWGPFGMGPWKGHPGVYCRVCGWPEYHLWFERMHEPPGNCPDGHSLARSCERVLDRLMMNAWTREAVGGKEPHASMEMLRVVTGLTWPEIEAMCDATGRGSSTIAEMRARRARPTSLPSETERG